jgi:5-methylthioribose kinase
MGVGGAGVIRADHAQLIAMLEELGLVDPADVRIEPLTGGVSSDIFKVSSGGRVMAVKRALPKLKVASEWHAPVERNRYEVAWLEVAARAIPGGAPQVLAHDPASGLFAMTYLDPAAYPIWKALLREGDVDPGFATMVGKKLARVHAATAGDPVISAAFSTDHIFHAIRLEPYLEATARRHPDFADQLMKLSRNTLATKRALVHGDVSPKNILKGPQGPVFLDAECAWYGDPAFDLAFCLNHLLLKCLWNRPAAPAFLAAFDALAAAYLAGVSWEVPAGLEARAARLLPGLFLARIDGKSPVEYVTEERDRDLVRATATPLIAAPPSILQEITCAWRKSLMAG